MMIVVLKTIMMTTATMYKRRDRTEWSKNSSKALRGRRNVEDFVQQRDETTRYLLSWVDNAPDVFFELLGQNFLFDIQKCTIAESKVPNSNSFELSIETLKIFFAFRNSRALNSKVLLGLYIISGVMKVREELLHSFTQKKCTRKIFIETVSRNKLQNV